MNLDDHVTMSFVDSTVRSPSEQGLLRTMITDVLANRRPELLYRAPRDGFAAHNFRQKCDLKGPTVLVARSEAGYIFGAHTEVPCDICPWIDGGRPG